MAKVYCYWGDGSDPASSEGRSNSSDSGDIQCEFPTTVVFDRLDRKQRATKSPSDGTGSTYIDASPLSAEPPFPIDGIDRSAGRATPEYWDGSDGRVTTNAKCRLSRREKRPNHRNLGPDATPRTSYARHAEEANCGRNDALTWRMDPTASLSDFTLTVIGIDDGIAIEKHARAKKIRRTKRQSKRRDKWSVEDLYLDM